MRRLGEVEIVSRMTLVMRAVTWHRRKILSGRGLQESRKTLCMFPTCDPATSV